MKKLFLIDGIGVVVSAIILGFVLPQFQEMIGMPLTELFVLATVPIMFFAYDLFLDMTRKTVNFFWALASPI